MLSRIPRGRARGARNWLLEDYARRRRYDDDSSGGHIVEFRGAYAMNNHILSRTIAASDNGGKKRRGVNFQAENIVRDLGVIINISCDYENTFIRERNQFR